MGSYRDKLRSLHFRASKAGPKVTFEGDRRDGVMTTEDDVKQSVNVFIPPVNVEIDAPGLADVQEEVADTKADAARQAKEADA